MIALATRAARRRFRRGIGGVLLVSGFLALWPLQRSIDEEQGAARALADVLYMPSGKILRRLSLGYEGLLADIYWTRVVQYFGRRRLAHATRFELLGPLLRITTELDPQLLIAYRYGSIFLAEKPPGGAGQPDQALALLRRGIVANPDYWRLWQDLGFIYYWDLKDYPSAAKVFRAGSERPGAMLWMRVLAASVAARGGEIESSRLLWREIGRQAGNEQIRKSAQEHLAALDAREQIDKLNALLNRFREREGRAARSLQDLLAAGYLTAAPRDPSGAPYVIGPGGQAALGPHSKVDLQLLQ
jgi:tetratricopeptide (TPR) repeat protein